LSNEESMNSAALGVADQGLVVLDDVGDVAERQRGSGRRVDAARGALDRHLRELSGG